MDEHSPLVKKPINSFQTKTSKDPKYMSTSSFQAMMEGIQEMRTQRERSKSDTFENNFDNLVTPIREAQRKSLYGSLPFVAAFGMTGAIIKFC